MDYRILGPVEVRDAGRPVELRRQKPKALLAFLLLRARRPVTTGLLMDALWGERPPPTAAAALRNYVSQLRSVLGPDAVRSCPGGYLLDVAPEQIDLLCFEELTAEGRRATGPERVEKLREALALWRGPPLAELSEEFAVDEGRRLEELRASALEDLIDSELAQGSRSDLVAELEPLIAENPFRERLRGQMMLALYRRGRQAEALDVYRQTRRTLLDELGIEPGEALRELEQAILRQDPALAAPALRTSTEPAVQEERRKTVTVLFAELVSADELDPETLRSTAMHALSEVRGALEAHGGTIEQRSGDEVMAVFGVPRAHEDDALRAARAALELLGAVGEQAGAVGDGLDVRVGIDTAEVLAGADEAGHGFIAGPAISLARRRLQAAEPGEIRAGPGTVALLGGAVTTAPGSGSTDEGARIVGLVEGVAALRRHPEAPLVGRQAELGKLAAAFERVTDDRRCRLLLVLGEPGIGKTRLTAELTARLADEASVLTGRCVSYGRGATFLPLAELIRSVSAETDLRELLAADEHAELIAASLSELAGDDTATVSRSDTFWAVRRLFETLADERPVVLVLEDLHWAEPTLLDLLDYLAAQASSSPIFMLGVARPELLERRPEWSTVDAISLGPLSSADGESLIEHLADVPPRLRATILDAAGGNPLFVEQLLAHAREGGDPETAPPSLAALLASRLDRLDADELALLQRGALVGREFDRRAVADLRPETLGRIDEHVGALVRKGFLVESDQDVVSFHHVLIRDAAYSTLPKGQRAELHEQFARWLTAHPPVVDEIVGFHLEQASGYLVEIGSAADHASELAGEAGGRLAAAGLRAWRRADTTAAIDLLGRAAELLPPSAVARLELLCELGLALRTAGEIERADTVLQEAAELAGAAREQRIELRARIELANTRLSREPEGGAEELLDLLDHAIPVFEDFGDDRSLGRAWLLSGYVHGGLHCRNDAWLGAAERALVHYRRSRWPVASCAGEMATALYYGPVPAREAIARCETLLSEMTERTAQAHVLVWLGGLKALDGGLEPGRRMAEQAQGVYEEFGYRMALACGCCAVVAEIEVLSGRLDGAEAALRRSCEQLEAMQERACLASRAAELADVIYRSGRYEEAERWHAVASEYAASDDVGAQFLVGAIGAKLLARRGSFGAAERAGREAVRLAEQTDALNNRGKVLLDLAEVLWLSGRPDEGDASVALAVEQFERKGNRVAADSARASLEQRHC